MRIWECKIGEVEGELLPSNADVPLRRAVRAAYKELTGEVDRFCFSGWGAELTTMERCCVKGMDATLPVKSSVVVCQSEYSRLWYWRVYSGPDDMEQPLIASNGYIDPAECRKNLDLVRRAFMEEVTT